MKAKEKFRWLKENGPSLLITAAISVLVFLSQFPYLAGIISFVAVDGVFGYWYRNRIISNRARLKLQEDNDKLFNSEYYDLYNEFSYNQWLVILKSACLAFSLCPIIRHFIGEAFSYIGIGMALAVIFVSIATIISASEKRSKVLRSLCNERKDNWFGSYTEKELEILAQLEDIVSIIQDK